MAAFSFSRPSPSESLDFEAAWSQLQAETVLTEESNSLIQVHDPVLSSANIMLDNTPDDLMLYGMDENDGRSVLLTPEPETRGMFTFRSSNFQFTNFRALFNL